LTTHGYTPSASVIQRIENPPTTDANGNFGGGPGGFGGGGGTTRSTLDPATAQTRQAAQTACQSQAPAGVRIPGAGGPGGAGGAAFAKYQSDARAYISCVNDHGYTSVTLTPTTVTTPTTVAGQPPGGGAAGQGIRQAVQKIETDPAAASARQACAVLHPTLPARTAPSTTTTVG
jgi:hypothetical protein